MTNRAFYEEWWKDRVTIKGKFNMKRKHAHSLGLLDKNLFPLLDLGCGDGVFLMHLEQSFPGLECHGVEHSNIAIKYKKCNSNIYRLDINKFIPDKRFKCVSMIDVIEHIEDPVNVLSNIASSVDYLLITCPNFNFIKARIDVLLGKVPFQNKPNRGGHVYWCNLKGVLDLLASQGFLLIRENHLYPREEISLLKKFFAMRPSLFAHEFCFLFLNKNSDLNHELAQIHISHIQVQE